MVNTRKIAKEVIGWILAIVIAFFISALLSSKAFAKVQVQQSSMENTLYNKQQIIIDKISYSFSEPKKGDIIVFLDDNIEKRDIVDDIKIFMEDLKLIKNDGKINNRLVKRVIGTPGDEIDIKDGFVYVNGEKLSETYIKGETLSNDLNFPIKVEENNLFVLGDNRTVSLDSRVFGCINYNQVEGKVVLRVFPFSEAGKVK